MNACLCSSLHHVKRWPTIANNSEIQSSSFWALWHHPSRLPLFHFTSPYCLLWSILHSQNRQPRKEGIWIVAKYRPMVIVIYSTVALRSTCRNKQQRNCVPVCLIYCYSWRKRIFSRNLVLKRMPNLLVEWLLNLIKTLFSSPGCLHGWLLGCIMCWPTPIESNYRYLM